MPRLPILLVSLLLTVAAAAQSARPELYLESFPPRVVDAALPFALQFYYANQERDVAATGVTVIIDVRGAEVTKVPDVCSAAGPVITCTIGDLPFHALPDHLRTIDLELLAPDESVKSISIEASIDGNENEPKVIKRETRTYRTLFVTNTADAGSGSLREAMHASNAQCRDTTPCKIAFRIPASAAQWQTIRPETPLPVLSTATIIDGAVQATYSGDTNSAGPEIELSGARLTSGNGIESICPVEVRGLTINGFPGSGIRFSAASACLGGAPFGPAGFDPPAIEDNHLGTDPTGSEAVANERGIVFERGIANVRRNVISGNRRSGVFVDGGEIAITGNTIGLDRALTKGLGNGASGIYLGPRSHGSDVVDNYIGFNQHFGVSLDPHSVLSAIRGNSFQANWNLAIDFGLDGPTMDVPDATSAPVRRPVITSARYDAAADRTIIDGTSETFRDRHAVWVAIYANDEPDPSGFGEGQYYLGEVKAGEDQLFTFTIAGRPPGRWIAATSTRQNIIGLARTPKPDGICGCGFTTQTSEFSRTVEIE